jgi:hypothetical protein
MNYQTLPLQFKLITNRIRYDQHFKLDELIDFPYMLTPARMSAYLSSFSSREVSTCEQDFEKIVNGALELDTWSLKVIDAWGKPLPSGLLKGNLFWTGNYDECVEQLYLPNNKSFLPQLFDTQHCTYKNLF